LERLLGRKTMEVEILKEALDLARAKKPILPAARRSRWKRSVNQDETVSPGS
jgi:CO dehydrogenase/acetyl-CoA synthase gamma subunit (corrinoid Fe-S protein)